MSNVVGLPRSEYPRPQFERASWLNLNGEWEFEFDDRLQGLQEKWFEKSSFSQRIQVPYCHQSKLSGIEDPSFHDCVWYRREMTLPESFASKRVLLHFGAVDYAASVWVNGQLAGTHEGGHTPFHFDVTNLLAAGSNVVVVRAYDPGRDRTLPRGKQYWEEKSRGIWYTRTTGIWQTVWLEAVADVHLAKAKLTPNIDKNEIHMRLFVNGERGGRDVRLTVRVSFEGREVAEETIRVHSGEVTRSIGLGEVRLWSPNTPRLYDVEFRLAADGVEIDRVSSYFGMRKVSVENGRVLLNNHPYFMKLVLDQGYFPEGILTAPTDEALRRDVELTKAMGFNGARKHQKIEDPRYLYWCDKLGLLVWGEMANAYQFDESYVKRMTAEWQEAIERDYNHPCVVAWVPINESWGVPMLLTSEEQRAHALAMYHLTKSLDPTRFVISNDGWEHVRSDLFTIHDYESRREVLQDRYSTREKASVLMPGGRFLIVPGYSLDGAPILVTEYGGIKYQKSDWEGWGYSAAKDDRDFIERYAAVTHPLLNSPVVQGFCYTQLTDVEQEINGLLTYDRVPKIPLDTIKALNEGKLPQE